MLALLALLSGCGASDDDDKGAGAGTGGAGTGGAGTGGAGTGGAGTGGESATGGSSSATGATLEDHLTACQSFCDKFMAQCGVPCPESCENYVNANGAECAAPGVTFFDCYSALDPSIYSCDTGYIQGIATSDCDPERNDAVVCRAVEGVKCERWAHKDGEDCGTTPATPFAHYCVASAVPDGCVESPDGGGMYCCPTE